MREVWVYETAVDWSQLRHEAPYLLAGPKCVYFGLAILSLCFYIFFFLCCCGRLSRILNFVLEKVKLKGAEGSWFLF